MASGTSRRKIRCETGRGCCKSDHQERCTKAGARTKWRRDAHQQIAEAKEDEVGRVPAGRC